MKQRYTSKKTYINARYSNIGLWMHINPRVRKRFDEFWKYFFERLSLDKKLIDVESFDALKFDFESLITKQVYAMALTDNLYQENENKAKFDWTKEDEKLDNLIEMCFSYPTLFTSMLIADKRRSVALLNDFIMEIRSMLSPEAKSTLEFYAKAKTFTSKPEFEQIIKSAKNHLQSSGIKPAQYKVAEFLNIANSTFRDKLKNLKINFSKL